MKYLIGALVVANLLALAWFNGWMAPLGGDPREPDRMAGQIEPQRLRVVPPDRLTADGAPAASSSSGAPSSTSPMPEPAPRSAR